MDDICTIYFPQGTVDCQFLLIKFAAIYLLQLPNPEPDIK